MKYRAISLALLATIALAGCQNTSLTKTKETKRSYAVFDLQVEDGVSSSDMAKAIKTALQANTSAVKITEDLPPYPLPQEAPRFQLVNPFGNNSGIAALAGGAIRLPTCEGALVYAQASDTSMNSHGENTQFYTCLWQYEGGYHVDIYTQFDIETGGFENLGVDFVRSFMGDSSKFIPRTIASIQDNLNALNAEATLVTAHPSDFETLIRERQAQ